MFAGVAAFSLLTKYAIRYRGSHLFNPSNIGLVVAFVVLGSERVEPLDFWWAPLNGWMAIAYAVILGGGLLITTRLGLLGMAVTFWLALAAGVGVLAVAGHCMTARWAFAPVCGFDYWRVIMTSPEVLIFLFFMITDPKTVPAGRVGRVTFGVLVAMASTLLMAPQTDEFGTKVALLAGLVVVCALRPVLERFVPDTAIAGRRGRPVRSRTRHRWRAPSCAANRSRARRRRRRRLRPGRRRLAGGRHRRHPDRRCPRTCAPATSIRRRSRRSPSSRTCRTGTTRSPDRSPSRSCWTSSRTSSWRTRRCSSSDASILTAINHGDRLDEMRARLEAAEATGVTEIERYQIDDVTVTLLVPFGKQEGLSLGLESRGTVTEETYDAAGELESTHDVAVRPDVRRPPGDRSPLAQRRRAAARRAVLVLEQLGHGREELRRSARAHR